MTIRVRYSCPLCGLKDVWCDVPARGDEGVIEWADKVMIVALSRDHHARSPHCVPKDLKDIKIPITGADKIGGAPVQ